MRLWEPAPGCAGRPGSQIWNAPQEPSQSREVNRHTHTVHGKTVAQHVHYSEFFFLFF